jgi:hypothetical protein
MFCTYPNNILAIQYIFFDFTLIFPICYHSFDRSVETRILGTAFATILFYHYHPVPTFWAFHLHLQVTIWTKEFDILQWSTIKKSAYVNTTSWTRLFWVTHLNTVFVLSSQMVYALYFISLFHFHK